MTTGSARAALSRAVNECRRLLVGDRGQNLGDLGRQLEAPFGFDPRTGAPRPLDDMTHLLPVQQRTARRLRDWHAHLVASVAGVTPEERTKSAYDEMKYELGYTVLHRVCALRMAEERGIIVDAVKNGRESAGFRLFLQAVPNDIAGPVEEVYVFFLERLFDELAAELPAVFDRRTPASLLFASASALEKVLDVLRRGELVEAWKQPDTLGWIFEDYNDPEERQEMRRKSDAPRNARELAIRNQFFTPRWVVEFLTDNTVGRRWVEACGGRSRLVESCRFLAKLPDSAHREAAPVDPRDLKVLDPACGSGHFLLYAFDLLLEIYAEAWEEGLPGAKGRPSLREAYPDEGVFQRELPHLIVDHNLYGVDIDPRCIQQAALSLWLRAHDAWNRQDTKRRDRPALETLNLVCSQSLPASSDLRAKLLAGLESKALADLVEELLKRAGEMGLLFRPEKAFGETIAAVKKRYREEILERRTRGSLFAETAAGHQPSFDDIAGLRTMEDVEFWEQAEEQMRTALTRLVEADPDPDYFRRALFAEDLRNGLRLLDLGRLRFDAVLMNPPFGEPSEATKDALDAAYPNAGHDLYAMFYERALELLAPAGRVGAITSRSWLALPTLGDFRKEVLGRKGTVELAADFGYGVLNAKVETAAAVMRAGAEPDLEALWVRLVKTSRKEQTLAEAVSTGASHRAAYAVSERRFVGLPERVYGYWMSAALVGTYGRGQSVAKVAEPVVGLQTSDDFRFLRLAWEVAPAGIGLDRKWARFAKGGEYRPFYDDVHLVVRWEGTGKEIAAFPKAYIRNPDFYGRRGVTWPRRTNLRLSARVLPEGCAFGDKGPTAIPIIPEHRKSLLAMLTSSPAYLLLSVRFQNVDEAAGAISKSYEVGLIKDLPWPALQLADETRLEVVGEAAEIVRVGQIEEDDSGETVAAFAVPPVFLTNESTFEGAVRARVAARDDRVIALARIEAEIDATVADAYGFTPGDRVVMDEELEPAISRLAGTDPIDETLFTQAYLTKEKLDGERLPGGLDAEVDVRVEHRRRKQMKLRDEETLCRMFQAPPERIAEIRRRLGLLRDSDRERMAADVVSWAVGVAFGRWDVRLAAHPEWIPRWADPFDAVPPCPLGQLVNAEGMPATSERLASESWLALRTDPTKLPAKERDSEVTAAAYPIDVAWEGLLWDDGSRDGRRDGFVARVERVLEVVLGPRRVSWEADICAAIEKKTLTDWLRTPSGFFADHLGRHTKSRRAAPIYWPLQLSDTLTCWVYAPRFDRDLVTRVVNGLHTDLGNLRHDLEGVEKAALDDARRSNDVGVLREEIRQRQASHDRLLELLDDGYTPHLDDGFVVSAAPLSWAFALAKWRDELAAVWNELRRGDYDWSHLAMALWSDRVRGKCAKDKSLAIAHGLAPEELVQAPKRARRGGNAAQGKMFVPPKDET